MKKIVICDDEFLVRKGISSLVDWSLYGYELCGDFGLGKDVIENLPNLKPDIILTDLFMQPVSGFELITSVKELYPNIKIVVLSNYNDFENVKKAMKLGADDYIFKLTLDAEELIKILNEITQDIDHKVDNDFRENDNNETKAIKLNNAIINKDVTILQELKLNTNFEQSYRVFALRIEGLLYFNDDSIKNNYFFIQNMSEVLSLVMKKKYSVFDIIIKEPNIAVIIYNDDSDLSFNQFFENICLHLEQCYGYSIGLYLSAKTTQFDNLLESVEQVLSLIEYSYHLEIHHCCTIVEKQKIVPFVLLQEFSFQNLKLLQNSADAKTLVTMVKALLDYILGKKFKKSDIIACLFKVCRYLYFCFDQYGLDLDKIKDENNLNCFELVKNCDSFPDLKDKLVILLDEYISLYENKIKLRKEIRDAISYIEENLDKSLTIAQVSEQVFMSESHFAHEFSSQVGIPFNKYLINKKMEKAKNLLRVTDLRISEISESIGISNPNYFSAQFKKSFNMNPLEYRKSCI